MLELVPKHQATSEGCIEKLKWALELAERGEITAVAIAGYDRRGFTVTTYEDGGNIAALIGACERVKYRLLKHQDEN